MPFLQNVKPFSNKYVTKSHSILKSVKSLSIKVLSNHLLKKSQGAVNSVHT